MKIYCKDTIHHVTKTSKIKKLDMIRATCLIVKAMDDLEYMPDLPLDCTLFDKEFYMGGKKFSYPFFESKRFKGMTIATSIWAVFSDLNFNFCYGTYIQNVMLLRGEEVDIDRNEICLLPIEYFTKSQCINNLIVE